MEYETGQLNAYPFANCLIIKRLAFFCSDHQMEFRTIWAVK